MATYRVALNKTTRVAKIQPVATAIPSGSIDAGSFDHDADPDDELEVDVNHVLYHHVRDLLYKQKVEDMGRISITR